MRGVLSNSAESEVVTCLTYKLSDPQERSHTSNSVSYLCCKNDKICKFLILEKTR